MNEIRAIIADDEALLRHFLRARLSEVWPELIISGEAQNGKEALALIERHHPHFAFLDIRMPGLTGMEVADKIAGACRVVFVTVTPTRWRPLTRRRWTTFSNPFPMSGFKRR